MLHLKVREEDSAARASYRVDCQYSGRKRAGRIAHGACQAKYTIEAACEAESPLAGANQR